MGDAESSKSTCRRVVTTIEQYGIDNPISIEIVESEESQDQFVEARCGESVIDLNTGILHNDSGDGSYQPDRERVSRDELNAARN